MICRTPDESFKAGWDDGADDPPMSEATATRLAVLWAPYIGQALRSAKDDAGIDMCPDLREQAGAREKHPSPQLYRDKEEKHPDEDHPDPQEADAPDHRSRPDLACREAAAVVTEPRMIRLDETRVSDYIRIDGDLVQVTNMHSHDNSDGTRDVCLHGTARLSDDVYHRRPATHVVELISRGRDV